MKMRVSILTVLMAALVCAEPTFACGGRIFRLVNKDGWKVPNVASMQETELRGHDGSVVKVPNGSAYVPKVATYFDFLLVSTTEGTPNGELQYSIKRLPIMLVVKYELDGHVVAYYIAFNGRSPDGGTPGCTIEASIYDNDGDGIFEIYEPFSGMPRLPKATKSQ